jgi:hypothetical protein
MKAAGHTWGWRAVTGAAQRVLLRRIVAGKKYGTMGHQTVECNWWNSVTTGKTRAAKSM